MYAIMALSVVLYARCFLLIAQLRKAHGALLAAQKPSSGAALPLLRHSVEELRYSYQHQRLAIGTMIAAAPLLGLLGTVSGMSTTFENLASHAGEKSMEGLAGGISEVLVATESGLSVAIPAMLAVYLAHRRMHKILQRMNQLECRSVAGLAL